VKNLYSTHFIFNHNSEKYKQKEIINNSIVSEMGQIIISKEIREKLGIAKGDKLILNLKENKIIITKS